MKKTTLLFAVALLTAAASFAQKGSVLVGGNLDFGASKYPEIPSGPGNSSFNFGFLTQTGYQFNQLWTVGVILGYIHYQTSGNISPNTSTNDYTVGPFVRYTRALNSWISVYGQFQATRQDEGKVGTDLNGNPEDTYVGDIQVFPALFFNVKNGFGLNVSFGGLEGTLTHTHNLGTTEEGVVLTFGNNILIGISKNFGGHRKAS